MPNALAIYGMGITGQACFRFALANHYDVYCWDDNADQRQRLAADIDDDRLHWHDFAKDGIPVQVGYMIMSPGIPWNGQDPQHPAARVAKEAKVRDVPLGCDIDFLLKNNKLPKESAAYAVTGTNGKTSVVSWLAAVANALGYASMALGNNGAVALAQQNAYKRYFFELSSYQLDLIHHPAFARAGLLNISTDHLQRYGSMENYASSKARIVELLQNPKEGLLVYCPDDPFSCDIAASAQHHVGNVLGFSSTQPVPEGIYLHHGCLMDARVSTGMEHPFCVIDFKDYVWLNNLQHARNLTAVYALLAGDILPDDPRLAAPMFIKAIQQALPELDLAHRQNPIASLPGVVFVDDSKSTNFIAAADALAQFKRIHWIVGGQCKDDDPSDLGENFDHVAGVYLIGASSQQLWQILKDRIPPDCPIQLCGDMLGAVQAIAENLGHDVAFPETVLLAPACASFDQFRNFEHRGQAFAQCIQQQWLNSKPFERSESMKQLWQGVHHGLVEYNRV